MPNKGFEIPRWHMDGKFFDSGEDIQYKAVVALKGPATLFFEVSSEQRQQLVMIDQEGPQIDEANPAVSFAVWFKYENSIRRLNRAQLLPVSQAITAKRGYGTLFAVGNPKNAAVHSEPNFTTNRFFMGVVTGTREQILGRKAEIEKQPKIVMHSMAPQ